MNGAMELLRAAQEGDRDACEQAVLENNGTAEEFRKKSIAFLDSHGIIKGVCSG